MALWPVYTFQATVSCVKVSIVARVMFQATVVTGTVKYQVCGVMERAAEVAKLMEKFQCRCRPKKWRSGTFDCVAEICCHGDSTENARELAACEALTRRMLKVNRWMR